jgi:hypothetical protein
MKMIDRLTSHQDRLFFLINCRTKVYIIEIAFHPFALRRQVFAIKEDLGLWVLVHMDWRLTIRQPCCQECV